MSQKVMPSLESITVRGKYVVQETDFKTIEKKIAEGLAEREWGVAQRIGESVMFLSIGLPVVEAYSQDSKKLKKTWSQKIKETRYGVPLSLSIIAVEHTADSTLLEIECKPAMYYKIASSGEKNFTENNVQEALLECKAFIKEVMSTLRGKEVEPVSVYPIIQRREIRSRLLNLGLKETVGHLDDAEKHIIQNNFPESLTSSRTAFEKTIDWQIKKRGLEKTDNYKNDLERLKARGHLDPDTCQLLQSYYHCISNLGVHQKGVRPGIYEAQMAYGFTLVVLDYFANKLP